MPEKNYMLCPDCNCYLDRHYDDVPEYTAYCFVCKKKVKVKRDVKLTLRAQGKYCGAQQYGVFVDDIEVGRMCREKYGKRTYFWNVCFWDMPDYGHQDRFEVPETFSNAQTCREWLKSNIRPIMKLKRYSKRNHRTIKDRIPEGLR